MHGPTKSHSSSKCEKHRLVGTRRGTVALRRTMVSESLGEQSIWKYFAYQVNIESRAVPQVDSDFLAKYSPDALWN